MDLTQLPKIALHEHLDGSLRPQTLLDIATRQGVELPATTAPALAEWCVASSNSGSLVEYLKVFALTTAVMQTAADLQRIAREFVIDQANDGVIYVETRWAPEQHGLAGLTPAAAVAAVHAGLTEGMAAATTAGRPILARQLLTAMRQTTPTTEIADLALTGHYATVAGFDLAGPELGFPPSRYAESFTKLRQANFPITIHAGEADGLSSIAAAVAQGAWRIGHGVRLVDDLSDGKPGDLAALIIEKGITLEICPTSNLQTGVCATLAEHPIWALDQADCPIAISCDNRLLSGRTLSEEYAELMAVFGYSVADLTRFNRQAAKAAFVSDSTRNELLARLAA